MLFPKWLLIEAINIVINDALSARLLLVSSFGEEWHGVLSDGLAYGSLVDGLLGHAGTRIQAWGRVWRHLVMYGTIWKNVEDETERLRDAQIDLDRGSGCTL